MNSSNGIAKTKTESEQRYHEEQHDKVVRANREIQKLRDKYRSPFTVSQMLEAASTRDKEILQYVENTGELPNVRDLPSVSTDPNPLDIVPEVFPKYVPGSSCPQKGQEHQFFKKGNRDLCAKCGSSRASRL